MRAYLIVDAVHYLFLGIWCTVDPDGTSGAIGFAFQTAAARSEYITVYGGLEVGLGLWFALAAWRPVWRAPAVGFAACLYGALALFRLGTLLTIEGLGTFPWVMFAIEVPMALLAVWLLRR